MGISAAYDLVGTYRAAAVLAGCDHHTVKRYVERRDAGSPPDGGIIRASIIDGFRPKIDEWVKRSHGRVGADVVHDKLVGSGSVSLRGHGVVAVPGRDPGVGPHDRDHAVVSG